MKLIHLKKVVALTAATLTTVGLAACSDDNADETVETPTESSSPESAEPAISEEEKR